MTAPAKLAAFAVAAAVAFGIGFGAGELVGPFGEETPDVVETHEVHP